MHASVGGFETRIFKTRRPYRGQDRDTYQQPNPDKRKDSDLTELKRHLEIEKQNKLNNP